jgi:signal transduction histidine kinase
MKPWLKWLGCGALASLLAWLVAWGVRAMSGGETAITWWLAVGVVSLVPAVGSLVSPRIGRLADPALVGVAAAYGLAAIVTVAIVATLLIAGTLPDSDAVRPFVMPAVVALAFAAVLALFVEPRVMKAARGAVYGRSVSPGDLARTFGSRMTRAIPLDELALQGAEALHGALSLRRVELWVPGGDELRPWIGDPPIEREPVPMGGVEPVAVVQAGLIGHGWMKVWLPELLDGRDDAFVRAAPMAHAGELLGLLLVERPVTGEAFTADEERTVVELARQLGVAVHNARLDSALQESLDEVRRQADELQASRGRIVAAGDQARRTIERNLHDGAQQHLVALSVQLKLARNLIDKDPRRAGEQLDALGGQIQDTLQELRDLAHGIYPPLLADKGLPEALGSAARRAILPVSVRAGGLARYAPEVEATVYFCVLEALQNAGKYAGEGASVIVEVRESERGLTFEVSDDGVGFDPHAGRMGAGFTNMLDRLGAQGGTLRVASTPGKGAKVTGVVPAARVDV